MSDSPADALARAVAEVGADTVFGVPGGGPNLDMIGAFERAGLRFVLAHHETAACTMAGTYGLLTGRTGVAIATRGPGVANGANGVLQCTLDRFPLLFVTDCVAAADYERVGHQRIDQRAFMGPVTKGSGRLGGTGDARLTAWGALAEANSAPRGALHLDYDAAAACIAADTLRPAPEATYDLIAPAREQLVAAQRPVAVVGLGAIEHAEGVRSALERLGCPVLTTYQAAGVLPEGHPQLAGLYTNGVVESAVLDQADLVVAVGLDPTEPMPGRWRYPSPVIAVDQVPPDASFVPAALQLIGSPVAMLDAIVSGPCAGWESGAGAAALADARAALRGAAARTDGTFGPVELVDALIAAAPDGATVTVDAGAHFLAVLPFWPVRSPLQLLISNGAATMGFAVPAAIAAALARPGTPVVCCVGDGGLGMTLGELETIARLRLPITVVVFDDAALTLIALKQREGQGGAGAVRYAPVDFAAVGAAMGLTTGVATSAAEVDAFVRDGWHLPRLLDARIAPAPYRDLIRVTRG